MPKKTKRQKIIAQYRKKIKLLETDKIPDKVKINQPIISVAPIKIPDEKPSDKIINHELTINNEDRLLTNYFVTDLKKSIWLSFLIIALEIIFYFATIYNYLKI